MTDLEQYKEIENFIVNIYSKDILYFGDKSFYPQILKFISSINLEKFIGTDLICDNETFCKQSFGASINSISRGLKIPRETARRKVSELINLNWLIRFNSQIFVSQKWRKQNFENINNLKSQIIKISKNL